jgi:uncharacterized protein (TIGR02001 family)
MTNLKSLIAGAAVGAAALAGGPAFAATTGTLNATSEYTFRGVDSENGAAIQGSIDWSDASGIYAGTWASNSNVAGGTEIDVYAGWKPDLGGGFLLDLGAIYYAFPEDEETAAGVDFDYWEVYAGLVFGGFAAKIFYADDYFGIEDATGLDAEALYYTASYTAAISDTVSLTGQIGLSDGDGVEQFLLGSDDSYTDWSITLKKTLENGFAVSFGYVQTDIDQGGAFDDDPKFVVSLSKGFEF